MLLLFSFLVSMGLTYLVIFTQKLHSKFTADKLIGIQKYHAQPVSRIGGFAIFVSLALSVIFFLPAEMPHTYIVGVLISSFLIFLLGFVEDLIGEIPSIVRLLIVTVCSLVAIYYTNALIIISYSDFALLDQLLKIYPIFGLMLSLFCVVGLTNAFNIIDGYNGLSAVTAICSLITMLFLSHTIGLTDVSEFTLALIGAILGFLVFNYPKGKIFLGDGGAYLIGFVIAVLSIYIVHAVHGKVSPYAVLLINIYPIVEIGFSIFRRKILTKTDGMKPDNRHLHHLIYHRCVSNHYKNKNPMVVLVMLFYIVPQNLVVLYYYDNTAICLLAIGIYILYYIGSYFSILKFKTFYHLRVISK